MSTSIFVLGATGYVGGGILANIFEHPKASTFKITILTRSASKAKIFEEKFSVKTVVSSTDDEDLVQKLASEAHVVISAADSDNLPATKAILRGMKDRHSKTGDVPSLIHTSGTGALTTYDKGLKVGTNVYDDSDVQSMASLPPTQPHRNVDLAIVAADKEGYIKSYIVLPSTIYGIAHHALAKAGASNLYSVQIPALIKAAIARGASGVVGKGVPIWPNVDTDDVSDLYSLIFDGILKNDPAVGHGENGYYFGINGDHTWNDLAKEIGRVLVEKGVIKNAEPTTFAEEELVKYFGSLVFGYYFGSTARGVANHSRAIGWKPTKTTKDMLQSISAEVDALL
ncbi:hypothetical protein EUX98_g5181 [Antrodiella citrinella]|uniref:NmrA-like domain-containing protein n=1 Tax=Antrodiella citrinella TaxID=2447956 RepID=A0A4S4MUM4_9APHY|nr:hypothetical protein EUX98_g5181 [Antrodiella citrinella]